MLRTDKDKFDFEKEHFNSQSTHTDDDVPILKITKRLEKAFSLSTEPSREE